MRFVLIAILAITVSACATASPTQSVQKQSSNQGNELEPRQLGVGECGLFVWTADTKKRFILFSQADLASGAWFNDGEERPVTIETQDGHSSERQYAQIAFDTIGSDKLHLSLQDYSRIASGTRYQSGTLTQTTGEGWEKIVPVIGLTACR